MSSNNRETPDETGAPIDNDGVKKASISQELHRIHNLLTSGNSPDEKRENEKKARMSARYILQNKENLRPIDLLNIYSTLMHCPAWLPTREDIETVDKTTRTVLKEDAKPVQEKHFRAIILRTFFNLPIHVQSAVKVANQIINTHAQKDHWIHKPNVKNWAHVIRCKHAPSKIFTEDENAKDARIESMDALLKTHNTLTVTKGIMYGAEADPSYDRAIAYIDSALERTKVPMHRAMLLAKRVGKIADKVQNAKPTNHEKIPDYKERIKKFLIKSREDCEEIDSCIQEIDKIPNARHLRAQCIFVKGMMYKNIGLKKKAKKEFVRIDGEVSAKAAAQSPALVWEELRDNLAIVL
jgi:hypothetical protein